MSKTRSRSGSKAMSLTWDWPNTRRAVSVGASPRGRQMTRATPTRKRSASRGSSALRSLINVGAAVAARSASPFARAAGMGYQAIQGFRGLTPPRTPVKRRGRYVKRETGTFKGKLGGKLRRNRQFSKYGYNGNIFRFEQNGHMSDKQIVFLGHSIGFNPFIHGVMRAIFCTLMTLAQQPLGSWEEVSLYKIRLKWTYRKETDYSKLNILDQIFNVGMVYKTLGDYMYDGNSTQAPPIVGLKSQFAGVKMGDNLSLYSLSIYNEDASSTEPMARMYFDTYQMYWKVTSSIDIQNTTVADWSDDTNNANNNAALKTNIFANPLKGTLYSNQGKGNKWCNGFIDKNMGLQSGANQFFTPDPVTLQPTVTPAILQLFGDPTGIIMQKGLLMPSQYLKPPLPWRFVGQVKSTPCLIQPGDIKKDSFLFKGFSNMNNWFSRHGSRVAEGFNYDPATGKLDLRWNFGYAHLVALEKLLDAKGSQDKNSVAVSFETNQVYCIKLVKRKQKPLAPFTWVQSTTKNAASIADNLTLSGAVDATPGDGSTEFI